MKTVIKRPLITEKNTAQNEAGIFVFETHLDSTKTEIKSAVEKLFDVKVDSVNTIVCRGHAKRTKFSIVAPKRWKKALVKLKAGEKIAIFEGA